MTGSAEEMVGHKGEEQASQQSGRGGNLEASQDEQTGQRGQGIGQQQVEVEGGGVVSSREPDQLDEKEVEVVRHGEVVHVEPGGRSDEAVVQVPAVVEDPLD